MQHLSAHGWHIRALVRNPSKAKALSQFPVEWVSGSLEDAASLETLLEGVTDVVHCAGVVRGASLQEFNRVNRAGVSHVVDAAYRQREPPGILYVSSLAAREPQLSWYAASKRGGEQELQNSPASLDWRILRPPAIYGDGDKELLPLFKSMKRGFAPVPGPLSNRLSLIHVQDVAAAIEQCLLHPVETRGRVMELHDGHDGGYDWREILDIAERVFSRRIRSVVLPQRLLSGLAWINLQLARSAGYSPMLTPGKLGEITHSDWVCDNAEIYRHTGWRPKILFEEGLGLTMGS